MQTLNISPPRAYGARFVDKIVLVTGASKGIGAGIAKRLAAEGASVVVNYSSGKDGANSVVDEIVNDGGNAIAVGAAVTDETDVRRLFEKIRATYGRIDVLVNNAGIYVQEPIEKLSVLDFHRHFDVNVLGLLEVTKAALPLFPETGGNIVNIGSVVSTMAPAGGAGSRRETFASIAFGPGLSSPKVPSLREWRAAPLRNGRFRIRHSRVPELPTISELQLHSSHRRTQAGLPASCSWSLAEPECSMNDHYASVQAFFTAYDTHDVDGMIALCTDNATGRYLPYGRESSMPIRGGIELIWRGFAQAVPDFGIEVLESIPADGRGSAF